MMIVFFIESVIFGWISICDAVVGSAQCFEVVVVGDYVLTAALLLSSASLTAKLFFMIFRTALRLASDVVHPLS